MMPAGQPASIMKCFRSFLSAVVLALIFAGCGRGPGGEAGVAISFDDRFIADWYALRPLFNEFGAKVTFYITGDTLTAEEAGMLRILQDEGHEIGFHGTIHGDAGQLLRHHGADGYLSVEIWPGLNYLRSLGFNPVSYAHPGGTSTTTTDSVLLANGFVTLREVSKAERYFRGVRLYHLPPASMPHIYYDFDGRKSFYALQIDRETSLSTEEMGKALEKAARDGEVLMLFGHQPLPENPSSDQYGFEIAFLRTILEESRKRGLKFYTMSELQTGSP